MRYPDRSLPLAFVLAAAVQLPGMVVPEIGGVLRPGALAPLLERSEAANTPSGQQDAGRSSPHQRAAQRFSNFGNCGGRSC
jgi:hypothetical protein